MPHDTSTYTTLTHILDTKAANYINIATQGKENKQRIFAFMYVYP